MRTWSQTPVRVLPVEPLTRRPLVTVVVLCYQYGRYLPSAVASVLGQHGVDVHVLIVDDASPDGSGDVADALASNHSVVESLRLVRNLGPVGAYNQALAHVRGEYIVRLDADDLLTPGALRRGTALLEAHPSVGLVYGRPRTFTGAEPQDLRDSEASSWSLWSGREWLTLRCRRAVNCLTSPEAVVRTDLHRRLGVQREELGHTHDMEMWMRIAAHADIGRLNNIDQALVRVHPDSRMRTTYNSPLLDLQERLQAFELVFSSMTFDGSAEADLRLARRNVARQALDRARHAYERGLTDVVPVHSYVALATRADPEVLRSAAYRALQRRIRVGPTWAPLVPWWFASAARRGIRGRVQRRAWKLTGL